MATTDNDAEVAALLADGHHAEAAAALLRLGHPARAALLLEQIWDFAGAARAAHAAGDLANALRYSLEARDAALSRTLIDRLSTSDDGVRTAMELLARARQYSQAADLAISLGDHERAIELLPRAQRDFEAATLLETLGRDRQAGQMLERLLEVESGTGAARAHLALGRILARRGALDEAARHLQEAARDEAQRVEARSHLIAVLATMGLKDAARDVLLAVRIDNPDVSADLDTFVRTWREAQPSRAPDEAQLIAGRYRVEKPLGSGSAGRVLLAHDEIADRMVALKLVHGGGGRGGAAFERFRREAQVTSTLRHPSLVNIYDVALDHGLLVMEYLPGGSLAQRLAMGDFLGDAAVRRLALEILGALEVAHQRGVVHRDIKPANILFDARGTAKLSDFGVAHLVDLGQTQTGGLIGTLAYMSPEQITGAPITVAADLYGLGVVLFEALTGRLPFLGPDFVAQHLSEEAPAPSTIRPDISPAWDPILLHLLAKVATARKSVAATRAAIEAVNTSGPAVHLPTTRTSAVHPAQSVNERAVPDPKTRYTHETSLGRTAVSLLGRAVDSVLDRSVIVERFDDSDLATQALLRVRAMAAASTPFVQRALSLDEVARIAVFEAPAGAPWNDAALDDSPRALIRLLKRLARGLCALHEVGITHGAITPATVVVDAGHIPTLLAAGLGPQPSSLGPEVDVAAVLSLIAKRLACPSNWPAICAALAPGAVVPRLGNDGVELFSAVDELETSMLRRLAT